MDAAELLARAGIFESRLPDWGVEMKIHKMDYPFFLQAYLSLVNEERDFEDFERYFNNLAKVYMTDWILNTEKKSTENLSGLFNFQKDTDLKKIFKQIVDGDYSPAEILFKVSNARMEIRRFGNVFGIKMQANSGSEIHEDGTKLLGNICRENRAYVQEFLNSIEFIVPLPKKQGSENSSIVDFEKVFEYIERACPYVQWPVVSQMQNIEAIIKHYVDAPQLKKCGPAIGACGKGSSLSICANLIHYEDEPMKKVSQWRKGNVSKTAAACYQFSSCRDLCLSLQIKGYFTESMLLKKIDTNLDVYSQQREMISAGAMIFKQLSAMIDGGYKSFECA